MRLIINGHNHHYHVAQDIVRGFETAILLYSGNYGTIKPSRSCYNLARIFNRLLHAEKMPLLRSFFLGLARFIVSIFKADYFVILMGCDFVKTMPFFLSRGKKHIYLFDAWPNMHSQIIDFLNSCKVSTLFVSSRQASDQLSALETDCRICWVAEGINKPAEYVSYDYNKKDIDVIQIGRRYDLYHQQIVDVLARSNRVYLFEKKRGELIFPQWEQFILGLARTKISICFPASLTHPERAMGIETMTQRYLQSMACKCLIVGKAPAELIDLFGYNPVVDAEMENSGQQLLSILSTFEKYAGLLQKNLETLQNHTWQNRWRQIESIIY